MPDPDAVTVVIPTRDRWPLLLRALDSVLAQGEAVLEVIVVDDGSSEAPPEDARLRDPRVRVVHHAASAGVAAARNHGIALARGGWVAFLDDDDLWAPSKLAAQLAAVGGTAGVGMVYGSALLVTHDLEPLVVHHAPDARVLLRRLADGNHVPAGASNVLVRTELARDLGGFDESFSHLADWDLWLRLLARAEAAAAPEVLVAYVQHAANMSVGDYRPLFAEYDRLGAKHAGLVREAGAAFAPGRFLRWVVQRQRRGGSARQAGRCSLEGALRYRDPAGLARGLALLALPRALLDAVSQKRGRALGEEAPQAPAWLAAYRDGR